MATLSVPARAPLRWSAVASLAGHGALVGLAIAVARGAPPPLPPAYRVELVAAPAGPRAIGEVTSAAAEPVPPAAAPARAEGPTESASPRRATGRTPVRTTPTAPTPRTKARPSTGPRAGGGPTGATGADVANVSVPGISFPYPEYLENVVRQIALRFTAPGGTALVAEVSFLIRRDGSVASFAFRRRSGNYGFDLEAQGAVEAAGRSGAFGRLPEGFRDDVLTVIFSFDPQLIR